jgi:hypothetical protein
MSRRLKVSLAALVAAGALGSGAEVARAQSAPAAPPETPPELSGGAPSQAPAPPADSAPAASGPGVADDTGRAAPPRLLPATSAPDATSAAPAAAPEPAGFRWQLFGYLRVQAALVQNDPNVAFIGRDDGFALQNARLGVRGQLAARTAVELSVDGAVDEREVNAANGTLRFGLRDALVELQLAAPLALRVGRFEAWFDPDNKDGALQRPFVDRALPSRGVRATEGWETRGLPPGRSLGVALRWGAGGGAAGALAQGGEERAPAVAPPPWQLEVAAQNGAAEFASGNDNDALALSAALRVTSARLGWVQVAGRWNPRTEGELPFRQEETDLQASLGAGVALGPVQLAAGGQLVSTRFETTGGASQRAWGAHGQGVWRAPLALPLDLGYRFAILDPSSLVLTDRLMEHTIGVVLGLPRWRSRALLNATHAVEQDRRELANDRVEAVLEVAL